ncbi:serpentine type 7TM GPCR chemoreceptor str domain-containing protein [Ditylenchus destructor]|uniref:Serpentine type 7TM GPCR chemoreceptor str domain-containing protein n=1 Tax=Ditylenchus destructor TaxID=166010 RepID=A0AAD4MTC7_9BILA|nr:serpentine type 7TM GPCR chemoreceptor str domain-containing protein [Ditylenchus destructor]
MPGEDCPAGLLYYRVLEQGAAAISYCVNAFLIYLIVFHTPNDLKVYSRLLLCSCVVDCLFTTALFFTEPHAIVSEGVYFVALNGPIHTPNPSLCFFLLCIFLFTFNFTVVFVTIPFVYRYFLICRNTSIGDTKFYLLIAWSILSGTFVPIACYFCYYDHMWSILLSKDTISFLPCDYPAQIPFFAMELTWATATPLLIGAFTITYNYTIIVWCSVKIWSKVNSMRHMSQAVVTMNRQLNYMLLVQSISPIALMAVPVLAMFGAVFIGVKEADGMLLVTVAISWVPVLNPLSTIYFVKCYRIKICYVFCGRKEGKQNTDVYTENCEFDISNDVFL